MRYLCPPMSTIVTLTTDFGLEGYRVAALKGTLVSAHPEISIIDVSHQITPFDIDEAAFILRSAFRHFPTGSVHMVNVMEYYSPNPNTLFFEVEGHKFIGPNNGVFSLIFDSLEQHTIYRLTAEHRSHYSAEYALILKQWQSTDSIMDIAEIAEDCTHKLRVQPVVTPDELRGMITYIDRFGNLITNITEQLFDEVRGGRDFTVYLSKYEHLHHIDTDYAQVPLGSPLIRFNAQDYMEIAVHLQRADQYLELKKGDTIQIKFST